MLRASQKYAADHTGRGEALARMPLEPNVTLVVSRSETAHLSLQALGERLTAIRRPDVNVLVLSPKVRRIPSQLQETQGHTPSLSPSISRKRYYQHNDAPALPYAGGEARAPAAARVPHAPVPRRLRAVRGRLHPLVRARHGACVRDP